MVPIQLCVAFKSAGKPYTCFLIIQELMEFVIGGWGGEITAGCNVLKRYWKRAWMQATADSVTLETLSITEFYSLTAGQGYQEAQIIVSRSI